MAEINGLLNRRTTLKLYRGFESLPHRIQGPQLLLWLFIFQKIFYYGLKLFGRRRIESPLTEVRNQGRSEELRFLFDLLFYLILKKTNKEQEEYYSPLYHHCHICKTKKAKTVKQSQVDSVPVAQRF